ncbi:hypothetical protein cand_031880 [Cryptosporidium andersoni]|uniref:Uncharacterized protein n=1 Tax=Cryptosporidium andersoni TaxID=117008 RepID=A0A1J4MDB6_9CRYT|nr:hypothetical protein cand_031880 [Cryptosporidium andersoni]
MSSKWAISKAKLIFYFLLLWKDTCDAAYNFKANQNLFIDKDLKNHVNRSPVDSYVFSNNMLQLSSQFPTLSPYDSLTLIWSSISGTIKPLTRSQGALLILFLINPAYRFLIDENNENKSDYSIIEILEQNLSAVIFCLIQTERDESVCDTTIDLLQKYLSDKIMYDITASYRLGFPLDIPAKLDNINELLSILKGMEHNMLDNYYTSQLSLFPTQDPDAFILFFFNTKSIFELYYKIKPIIPFKLLAQDISTFLDILNKDWDLKILNKKRNVQEWFSTKASPYYSIFKRILEDLNILQIEINKYTYTINIEKLILLAEVRVLLESIGNFCQTYINHIDQFESSQNEITVVDKKLKSFYELLTTYSKEIAKKYSLIYSNSRAAADTGEGLPLSKAKHKALSSENLTESDLNQDITSALLKTIANFFIEHENNPFIQETVSLKCPITKGPFNEKSILFIKEKYYKKIGNLIKDLSSVLILSRMNLASMICGELKQQITKLDKSIKKIRAYLYLLYPRVGKSLTESIFPSLVTQNGVDEYGEKVIIYNPDDSCTVISLNILDTHMHEITHVCTLVKDQETLTRSVINKIASQKVIHDIGTKIKQISQSQVLHEFHELANDIKATKFGHFVTEVGNTWSSSFKHWYHLHRKRSQLRGSRKLLRHVFYIYTSTLDNIIASKRPEFQQIQLATAKLNTKHICLLSHGYFGFIDPYLPKNERMSYSKHVTKIMGKYFNRPDILINQEFPITVVNLKDLNMLIQADQVRNKIGNLNTYTENKYDITKVSGFKNKVLPYFEGRKTHYVVVGTDFSNFALCRCSINSKKQTKMLQLFVELLYQMQYIDLKVTGFNMLSYSLKKAIRQMLIIVVLNEFSIHLLPKINKDGYQRFYSMNHSKHKALKKRVRQYIQELQNNSYKLSVIMEALYTTILTAFNHFKYDSELNILRTSIMGVIKEKNNEYPTRVSEIMRKVTLEKFINNFYFGRIRRNFNSLQHTILNMLNAQQIFSLGQLLKTDRNIEDITDISTKLHNYIEMIYPTQNCIGISEKKQRLDAFFVLC